MEITRIVCGAVADRIHNSLHSYLYEISEDDTKPGYYKISSILKMSHVETLIFDKANEYSFKGT